MTVSRKELFRLKLKSALTFVAAQKAWDQGDKSHFFKLHQESEGYDELLAIPASSGFDKPAWESSGLPLFCNPIRMKAPQ